MVLCDWICAFGHYNINFGTKKLNNHLKTNKTSFSKNQKIVAVLASLKYTSALLCKNEL